MALLWWLVALLVGAGSVLALAEASISRITRARALALAEEKRVNAALLVRIEEDPARTLNSIYLAVMLVQNGSAILVAVLAERTWGELGITLASVVFTLLYFVLVEAMSKTFGILHHDRVALALAPVVWSLGELLSLPTRGLIGISNVLLPGKGLRHGPFVSEEEIRSMAALGQQEGVLERRESELIQSVFDFGDAVVREVMVPRPDMVLAPIDASLDTVLDLIVRSGHSRIPVYRGSREDIVGVAYAKDLLRLLHAGTREATLESLLRPALLVPESKRLAELLPEMQKKRIHMAIVIDEYGSTAGVVTLEDLLEELVGEISDEYDLDDPQILRVADGSWRMHGRVRVSELNELLDADLPDQDWDTVGGLVLGTLGAVPREGAHLETHGLSITVERVRGRRVERVLVRRLTPTSEEQAG